MISADQYEKGLSPNPANSGNSATLSGKTGVNAVNTIGSVGKTPDTPAHTPLPWVIDPTYPSEVQTRQLESITSRWHEQAVGQEITVTGVLPCSLTESAANAAFIVRACNSHYQLVDSLRAMQARECRSWCSEALNEHTRACVSARAALSQAGGASE